MDACPVILALVITFIMTKMNVEKANKELTAPEISVKLGTTWIENEEILVWKKMAGRLFELQSRNGILEEKQEKADGITAQVAKQIDVLIESVHEKMAIPMEKKILEQYIDACELIKETEKDIRRLKKKRAAVTIRNRRKRLHYIMKR